MKTWQMMTLTCSVALLLSACDKTNQKNNPPANPGTTYNNSNSNYSLNRNINTNSNGNSISNLPLPPVTTQPDSSSMTTPPSTADNAGQTTGDARIAADIHTQIMNGAFSTAAQNIKATVLNGKATLRGSVQTQDEKDHLGRIAANVAGAGNVDNQLEVSAAPATQPGGM